MLCICNNCVCNSDCGYYDKNIKPVLGTEKHPCNDSYLIALRRALDDFECEDYDPGIQKSKTLEDKVADILGVSVVSELLTLSKSEV